MYIDPFGHFVFYEIFGSLNFYDSFFFQRLKFYIPPPIYKSIIITFSVNLPLVLSYEFNKNEIQIQLPGEPQEHHLGEV